MSKGLYIGVSQSASTAIGPLNTSNLSSAFTITDGSNYTWSQSNDAAGGIKLVPENIGKNSSTATITLKASKALTNVTITGQYYTESGYDKISLTVADTNILSTVSGSSAAAQRWSGNLNSGQTIILTYTKDSSSHSDKENLTYFTINCDMTINLPAFNNKAKKVKKIYVGVSNIAHKVKKGYIGVNGIAKLFFNPLKLAYYKKLSNLTYYGNIPSAASLSDYAIFIGGHSTSNFNINYYSKSLTRSTKSYSSRYTGDGMKATSFADKVYVAGNSGLNVLYTLDNSLTLSSLGNFSNSDGFYPAATTNDNYIAFFSGSECNKYLYCYNSSNTLTLKTSKYYRRKVKAVSVKNYMLFAGGYYSSSSSTSNASESAYVDCLNNSLTYSLQENLTTPAVNFSTATVDNYALITNGENSANIDVYNKSLTKTNISLLEIQYNMSDGINSLQNYAIFAGGDLPSLNNSDYGFYRETTRINVFDESLILSIDLSLQYKRSNIASVTFNNYILLGGGNITGSYENSNGSTTYYSDPVAYVEAYYLTEA